MVAAKYRIVIDADVARSSGETTHPISASCRKVLELIMENEHKFVACKRLREEWRNQSSNYARKWMATMIARKQVCFVEHSSDVAQVIESLDIDEKTRAVALKDCHIIDAARLNGKFVTSRDDRAKAAFDSIEMIRPLVQGIAWANPVSDLEAVKIKLRERLARDNIPRLGQNVPA